MLEYEWGDPTAATAAMLLFGEDSGQERHVFDDHYGHHGLGVDLFPQNQQLTAPLSAASLLSCHQRYGLALPPAPVRIGLNLGVRTYLASGSSEEEVMVGRVCRRRTRTARCRADGCGADLNNGKQYHRRHKVCEFHSKAPIVIAAGLSQRFCQQCSRFHVLSEFDQGKRSCRKRLADHNRRRRKSQNLSTATVNSQNNNTTTNATATTNSPSPEKVLPPLSFMVCNTEPSSSITLNSFPTPLPPPLPPTAAQMALGLGSDGAVAVASAAGWMSDSSSAVTSHPSVSFLSHLGEFRRHDHGFPSWDDAEDGSSIRALFQNK